MGCRAGWDLHEGWDQAGPPIPRGTDVPPRGAARRRPQEGRRARGDQDAEWQVAEPGYACPRIHWQGPVQGLFLFLLALFFQTRSVIWYFLQVASVIKPRLVHPKAPKARLWKAGGRVVVGGFSPKAAPCSIIPNIRST